MITGTLCSFHQRYVIKMNNINSGIVCICDQFTMDILIFYNRIVFFFQIFNVSTFERRENILSVLTNNRNRFKCGREIKKKTTIWGLRVRLPPPAHCISLPNMGPISEEELRERWQGNRRLQFLPLSDGSGT